MKRTLLTFALMFSAVAVMAQTNIVAKQAIKEVSKDISAPVQKAKPAAKDLTPFWSCDFSNQSDFSFVNAPGHNIPGGRQFYYIPDTNDKAGFLNTLMFSATQNYFSDRDDFWDYWFGPTGGQFLTIANGFVGVNPITDWATIRIYNWNTTVTFNQPLVTTGVSVVDLYFCQMARHFNFERYYIEWSTDPQFTTKDSMEFNVRGVEYNSNDWMLGEKKLTLPVSDEIYKNEILTHDGIATVGQNTLYIRFRYVCDAIGNAQPHSYFWFIDDVRAVDAGSAVRMDLLQRVNYSGDAYHFVPQGMATDTVDYYVNVENTGGVDILGATLKTKIYSVDESTTPYTYTYTNVINESEPIDLTTARTEYTKTYRNSQGATVNELNLERLSTVEAYSTNFVQTNTPVGKYAAISTLGNATDEIVINDTTYFEVTAPSQIFSNPTDWYDWRKANNVIRKGTSWWAYGFTMSGGANYLSGYEGDDGWNKVNYSVCTRYVMNGDATNNWYANGISLVAAPDSCEAGGTLLVSLKQFNDEATDYSDAIIEVEYPNGELVESEFFTVPASALNNNIFGSATSTSTFNTMYIPFKEPVLLTPGAWYYACFKLVSDTRFAVASDYNFSDLHNFGPGDYPWNTLVYSGASNDFGWGNYYWGTYSDYLTPMIGMIVSHNATNNLNEIGNVFGTMNMYPNPAQNEATLTYSLKNAGDVTIVVTDIMGREVVKINEGKKAAGVLYNSNINTSNLSNGTYFYTLSVNGERETNKFVINK
ncbi:MAG: T9SS type A sorting domain-containing protein [Bacteroidales bacterium]|jgi:hypothetical protein|nr:T9SS type A sorting domain-containing protein [Bacteroidales bacterium]